MGLDQSAGPLFQFSTSQFQKATNRDLNGKDITANNLGFSENCTIEFEAAINGKDAIGPVAFKRRLKVVVGASNRPLPKPDANWTYGDAHYHTRFTTNPYEWGADLRMVKMGLKAIGLDWVTTTDHASDISSWDLNKSKWETLLNEANDLNDKLSQFPSGVNSGC